MVGELGRQLAVALLCSAARADADPNQLSRLRERLRGELELHREADNTDGIRKAVFEVMGPGWEPRGEWATSIAMFEA